MKQNIKGDAFDLPPFSSNPLNWIHNQLMDHETQFGKKNKNQNKTSSARNKS